MAWCQIDIKPLPEPTLTQFVDIYMSQQRWNMNLNYFLTTYWLHFHQKNVFSPLLQHNTNAAQLAAMSEAELQARAGVVHSGMPMPTHMLPGGHMPYFPSLPVIDSEFTPPNSPAYITAQMKSLEQARSSSKLGGGGAVPAPGAPYTVPSSGTEAQGSQTRLHRCAGIPMCVPLWYSGGNICN